MLSQRRAVTASLRRWMEAGRPAVLATVVTSSGSAPRGLGAQLAVTEGDLWSGGLSGGCAEVAVLTAAAGLMARSDTGGAVWLELVRDELGSVGPVCGATLGVLVERVDETLLAAMEAIVDGLGAGTASSWRRAYTRQGDALTRIAAGPLSGAAAPGIHLEGSTGGDLTVVEALAPPPRAVVAGAGDIASELLTILGAQGWRTALVDPRAAFADHTLTESQPDTVVREWPDAGVISALHVDGATACVAAAHDERIDHPFLRAALESDAFYVGAVGSRLVQHRRREALAADGVPAERLARLRGPAGLDLGGGGAAQIALSIAAEMTATWNGRKGGALLESGGPIRA
jgi:xanthine dehydrogenase accessory factor